MEDTARAQEMWIQFTGKTLEALTVWADANQRVMKEWVEAGKGIQAKLAEAVTKTQEIYARA